MKMKKTSVFITFLILATTVLAQKLEKQWSTPAELITTESALFCESENIIFAACIGSQQKENDGDGYIAKVNPDGTIQNLKWATGLNDPKGMAILNGKLYVADRNELVVIELKTGKILQKYLAPNAKFLNDVTLCANGMVFVSDSRDQRIYCLDDEKFESWLVDSKLDNVNGLWAENGKLYAGNAKIWEIDIKTKAMKQLVDGCGGIDGLERMTDDKFIFSNWDGKIFVSKESTVIQILDTTNPRRNSADIDFVPKSNMVYVPTFFSNTLDCYLLAW